MVVNRQRRIQVQLKLLEAFLDRVQKTLRLSKHGVTVCLVSDAVIARMNRTFRRKPGPTDVLSFPANGTRPGNKEPGSGGWRKRAENGALYLGDIAISPETAQCNARRFARTLPQELRILILHGMLHLAGYDHETDHGEMGRLEQKLRRRFGLS